MYWPIAFYPIETVWQPWMLHYPMWSRRCVTWHFYINIGPVDWCGIDYRCWLPTDDDPIMITLSLNVITVTWLCFPCSHPGLSLWERMFASIFTVGLFAGGSWFGSNYRHSGANPFPNRFDPGRVQPPLWVRCWWPFLLSAPR